MGLYKAVALSIAVALLDIAETLNRLGPLAGEDARRTGLLVPVMSARACPT